MERTTESEGLSLYQMAEIMKSMAQLLPITLMVVAHQLFTSMVKLLTIQQQTETLFQKGR